MANVKVSEMPQANTVNNSDNLMIVQQNVNKKVTKQILLQEINNSISNIETEQTSQNTSIAELQEENENLRNAMLQVSGQGTNITLKGTSKNKFTKFIVKGNTEQGANPTPNNPQIIHNVSEDLNVKVQNKNWIPVDISTQTLAGVTITVNSDKSITINGTTTGEINLPIGHINDLPIADYIMTGCAGTGSSTTWRLQLTDYPVVNNKGFDTGSGLAFTSNGGDYAIVIQIRNGITCNNLTFKPMIRLANSNVNYVAHAEQDITFAFGSGQKLMEGGYLASDGVYNAKKQIVLTGTENWAQFQSYIYLYIADCVKAVSSGATIPNLKCNQFTTNSRNTTYLTQSNNYITDNAVGDSESQRGICFINNANFGTVAECKQYLADKYANNTPVIVEYELATPTTTAYTSTQQSQYNAIQQTYSYAEQTNISSTSTDLSADLEVSAIADMNTAFQTLQSRVDLLEG